MRASDARRHARHERPETELFFFQLALELAVVLEEVVLDVEVGTAALLRL